MSKHKLFKESRRILTYSSAECFQECRQKWQYRYGREIVPTEPQTALDFGAAIHAGLEFWFKYSIAGGAVVAAVSRGAELGLSSENLCKVQVLIEEYTERYKEEEFEVVEVEKTLQMRLQNPKTGKHSRIFDYMGKVDGIVKIGNDYYILEHKTRSTITEDYIRSLEIKPQTALYALAAEAAGYPIKGAIYDIIEKPGIKMAMEETEEEFEKRKAELIAKSKTGKTTAQRRTGELPDEFMARLREKITPQSFRRVYINLDIYRKYEAGANLWATAQDMKAATIYPNTGACEKFGMCPYLNLCRAHGDLEQCGGEYTHKKAHCELEEEKGKEVQG